MRCFCAAAWLECQIARISSARLMDRAVLVHRHAATTGILRAPAGSMPTGHPFLVVDDLVADGGAVAVAGVYDGVAR